MSPTLQGNQLQPSSSDSNAAVHKNPNTEYRTKQRTLGGISFEAESLPEFSEFEDSDSGDIKQRVEFLH